MIDFIDVKNNRVPDHIYRKMKDDCLRDVARFRQFPVHKLTSSQLYAVCFAAGVPVKDVIKPGGL